MLPQEADLYQLPITHLVERLMLLGLPRRTRIRGVLESKLSMCQRIFEFQQALRDAPPANIIEREIADPVESEESGDDD